MILNTKRNHNSFWRNFPARAKQMPWKVLIVGKKKRRPRPPGHYAPKLKSLATVFELKIIIFVLNDLTVLVHILKQLFTSVSVLRSSVNNNDWSPPPWWIIVIYIAMSGFNVTLVNVKFLLSSLVCLAWVVFSDHFITESCYYQTKIFAGLLICVLATSLLVFQGQWIIIFSHTYSSLHSSISVQDKK